MKTALKILLFILAVPFIMCLFMLALVALNVWVLSSL